MRRFLVRCSTDRSIVIEAESAADAIKQAEHIDFSNWDTSEDSELEAEECD